MNRKGYIVASLIMLSVGIGDYVLYHFSSYTKSDKGGETLKPKYIPEAATEKAHNILYSLGTPDNPYGRVDFEEMRIRDPRGRRLPANMRKRELAYARRASENVSLRARNQATNVSFLGRGPANLGGRTRALALDLSDPSYNTILAGGVSGGMFRSTDGGQSWTRSTRTDQFPSVTCIAQDIRPGRENIWYYGTGEIAGNSADGNGGAFYRGDGIYRSIDGGRSWEVISTTRTGDITTTDNPIRYVNSIVIDHTNTQQDEIYAAVIDGIIRTTDGFETYEFVLGTTDNTSLYTDIAITSTGRLYATISDDGANNEDVGIWTSTDGINWEEIDTPRRVPQSGFQRTTIGISPSNEDIVYFLRTDGNGQTYRLFHYDAATGVIANRSSGIPELGGPVGDYDSQGSYNQIVAVHPANSDIVFLGGTNLYRSTNGFEDDTETDWVGGYSFRANENDEVTPYINHHPDQHAIVFYPDNPNQMLSGHDGGISFTNNNRKTRITRVRDENNRLVDELTIEWDDLNNNYITTQFYTLAIEQFNAGDGFIVGGMQDNSSHAVFDTNPESEWVDLFGGDGSYAEVTYNSIMVSAQFAQMIRYAFDEETGEFDGVSQISPPDAGELPYLFVNPYLADPVFPNKVFVGGRETLYYTHDIRTNPQGDDWMTIGDSTLEGAGNVSALAASISPANRLYIGTSRGRLFRVEDSNRPDDVRDITSVQFPTSGYINCVAVDPRDADQVFVIFSNYNIQSIYYSADGGDSWMGIGGNLEENPDGSGNGPSVRWLDILPNGTGSTYFLGTSVGLFTTNTLQGMNTEWIASGAESIGNAVVDMIKVRPIDGIVTVATHGKGIFEGRVEVPLQPHIFMTDLPCQGNQIPIFGNQSQDEENYRFSYEWLNDGVVVSRSDNPAIQTDGLPGSIQLRLTNEVTNEVALSNTINIEYIYDDLCDVENNVVSVEDDIPESLTTDFAIFPNPTTDIFNIRPGENFGNLLQIKIYDLQGRVYLQREWVNQGILEVDLSQQTPGYYFVEISDGESERVERIIKSN